MLAVAVRIEAQNKVKQNSDEGVLTDLVRQMATAQSNFDEATLDKIYALDYIEVSPIDEVDERKKAIGFYNLEANPLVARFTDGFADEADFGVAVRFVRDKSIRVTGLLINRGRIRKLRFGKFNR